MGHEDAALIERLLLSHFPVHGIRVAAELGSERIEWAKQEAQHSHQPFLGNDPLQDPQDH